MDDIIHQIVTRIRDPNWTCEFHMIYSLRNNLASYLSLLGGQLFCRLYMFCESIGRMAEIMDLDMVLGPHAPEFLEAPMAEEWEVYEEIMDDGVGALAEAFTENLVLQVPGGLMLSHKCTMWSMKMCFWKTLMRIFLIYSELIFIWFLLSEWVLSLLVFAYGHCS